MTTEIAIMNKIGVALAADSAVTIRGATEQKVYNSVNKLFMLSKRHPVGIMVYGEADLMGVPWETIIKMYRHSLGDNSFDTIQLQANNFVSFLEKNIQFYPEESQETHFYRQSISAFLQIRKRLENKLKRYFSAGKELHKKDIRQLLLHEITIFHLEWASCDDLPGISKKFANATASQFDSLLNKAIADVFEALPLTAAGKSLLKKICGCIYAKNKFLGDHSGVVITGFGDGEIYPSLVSLEVEGYMNGRLKWRHAQSEQVSINSNAVILPFAQTDIIHSFMTGVNPSLMSQIQKSLNRYVDSYTNSILEVIVPLFGSTFTPKDRSDLESALKRARNIIQQDFNESLDRISQDEYVSPVLEAVSFLPKDELAAMAEALVHLTSLKRKFSLDAETVGGPIDVAVISKGDGFVWIKRKHYFSRDLNHHYFSNYNFFDERRVNDEQEK